MILLLLIILVSKYKPPLPITPVSAMDPITFTCLIVTQGIIIFKTIEDNYKFRKIKEELAEVKKELVSRSR